MGRPPKKTDSIEVRLPTETKIEFMEACHSNRSSASAVLRSFIDSYLRTVSRAPVHWREELYMFFSERPVGGRAAAGMIGAALTAAVFVAAVATPARAATDPLLTAVFEYMDSNHDGEISAVEFEAPHSDPGPLGAIGIVVDTKSRPASETEQALFSRLDADHDGSISLGEFSAQAVAQAVLTPAIATADANQDGKITEGELAAYIAAQRSVSGLRDPARSAATMAHAIVAQYDRQGKGWVTLVALRH